MFLYVNKLKPPFHLVVTAITLTSSPFTGTTAQWRRRALAPVCPQLSNPESRPDCGREPGSDAALPPVPSKAATQKRPYPRTCLSLLTNRTKKRRSERAAEARRGERSSPDASRHASTSTASTTIGTLLQLPATTSPDFRSHQNPGRPAEGARLRPLTGIRSARRSICLSSRSVCGPS